jgi:hypothetical protein
MPIMDRPALVAAIRALRVTLKTLDDAAADAHERLDALETAAGVVYEDGSSEADG